MTTVKVPTWYRIKMNLSWRQFKHFVWMVWWWPRNFNCNTFQAISLAWSVWWMVIEDCGADPDDLPWKRK